MIWTALSELLRGIIKVSIEYFWTKPYSTKTDKKWLTFSSDMYTSEKERKSSAGQLEYGYFFQTVRKQFVNCGYIST